MRAAVKYGSLATLGSLVLSALVAVPAQSADADTRTRKTADATPAFGTPATTGTSTETHGVLRRRRARRCRRHQLRSLPGRGDAARPGHLRHRSRSRSTTRSPTAAPSASPSAGSGRAGKPADRQGALVFNPGGPGASSMYFPLVAELPEWKRIAGAYDIVGYAPRGVGRLRPALLPGPDGLREGADPGTGPPLGVVQAASGSREAKAYARGLRPTRRAPRCATTPRSTTRATSMCCGPRSASGS